MGSLCVGMELLYVGVFFKKWCVIIEQLPKWAKSRFGLDGLVSSKNTKMTRPPLSSLTLAVNLADEKPKHLLTCSSIRRYSCC